VQRAFVGRSIDVVATRMPTLELFCVNVMPECVNMTMDAQYKNDDTVTLCSPKMVKQGPLVMED